MIERYYVILLRIAAFYGIIGVSFGAFGAHYLKSRLVSDDLEIIRTGVLYLFIHTIAIIAIILLGNLDSISRILKGSGLFFVLGVFLFSGSLFLIATRTETGIDIPYIGILTPIGGLFFILGWALLLIYSFSKKQL